MSLLPFLVVALVVGAVALEAPARAPQPAAPLAVLHGERVADRLGALVAASGDAWMDDRARDRLLRVDGASGRVESELPVDGRVSLAAGAGAVWALQAAGGYQRERHGPLLRVDPATGRVTARIALRAPDGEPVLGFGVVAAPAAVYVWGPDRILRIDPESARVTGAVPVTDGRGELTDLVLDGDELVGITGGHVVRRSARTGVETGAATVPLAGAELHAASGGRVLVSGEGTLALLDPPTGRLAWRRRLGFRVGGVAELGGTLWVHASRLGDPSDRLWALDPATGEIRASALLPAFGAAGVTAVGRALWITSPGGRRYVLPSWLLRRLPAAP